MVSIPIIKNCLVTPNRILQLHKTNTTEKTEKINVSKLCIYKTANFTADERIYIYV